MLYANNNLLSNVHSLIAVNWPNVNSIAEVVPLQTIMDFSLMGHTIFVHID